MPSQIKVDEIKNVAGQYKIKTNVFEGQTTAGSITVQGEGSNTTNLQQGLQKNFLNMNGTGTIAIRDSFNTASITDIGTGNHSTTFTSSFRAVEYVFTGNLGHAGGSRTTGGVTFDDYTGSPTNSTNEYRFNTRRKDNASDTDCATIMNQVSGDLA